MNEEFWLIRGNTPVQWTMPFKVSWDIGLRVGSMHVAIVINHPQLVGIKTFLRGRAKSYGAEKFWRIKRHVIEEIGSRIENPGPLENYLSWARPLVDAKSTPAEIMQRMDRADFVHGLHQKGIGKSIEEVEWWWLQFCNHIGDTIINHHKPVDFYWFKLHFSPYRHNWKEYVLHRLPRLGMMICANTPEKREAYLHNEGAYELFLNPDMLALRKPYGYIYHHVEVEHLTPWWKETQRAEHIRLRKLGEKGYARHVLDSIKRRLKATIRLYLEYLNLVAKPSATAVECSDQGDVRLAPNATWRRGVPKKLQSYFVPVVVPNKFSAFSPASQPESLLGPNGELPEVPPVRSEGQDLRDRRGNDTGPAEPKA